MALTSLSSADYSGIEDTVTSIIDDPSCSGQVSVSLPSLRVDAFTVGTAAQIQRVRRTGLTFAPEGGTWRMRQVINKLIREEDLYAAVDAAFSQGWKRVKLYFLIGLPTETDEDTLGIVALAKQCVAIGKRYHKGVTVTASVGGFVPKVQTPFQWFGQNTIEELTRKVHLLRDAARPVRGLTIRWHDPKATAAEGIVSRGDRRMGAVIEQVWRRGGTFQEWTEHFDLDRVDRGPGRPRVCPSRTPSTATGPRTRSCPGTTSRPASTGTSCGRTGSTPWPTTASRTAGGPPATTVGPAPGSASSTWWPRPSPRPAGARARARISQLEARCRYDFSPRRHRVPVRPPGRGRMPPCGSERGEAEMRVRFRFTKLGKIRFTSQRDVARMWERALRRAGLPLAYTEGFSPRPQLSFGLALPTGCESLAEYLDVVLDEHRPEAGAWTWPVAAGPAHRPASRRASRWRRRPWWSGKDGSLQQLVTSCSWTMGFDGRVQGRARGPGDASPRGGVGPHHQGAQGQAGKRRSPTLGTGPGRVPNRRSRWPLPSASSVALVAELAYQPRGVRPVELVRGLIAVAGSPDGGRPSEAGTDGSSGGVPVLGRACRTQQWIERDGHRQEPLERGGDTVGADRAAHALERAS